MPQKQRQCTFFFFFKKRKDYTKISYTTTTSMKDKNASKPKLIFTENCKKSYHSWSSGEGIRPAVPFLEFSSLPCHQLWSSLLMIWIISPTRNLMPASLQGMRSSFAGSYSNCALTYIYKEEFIKDTAILLLVQY